MISFCAGHRLLDHEGKCANLHGHNYKVELHIAANETDQLGRVVDFSVVNRTFGGWIEEHWDHAMLLWSADREAITAIRGIQPHKVYELPFNPTAENLARYLMYDIGPQLLARIENYDLQLIRVVVWETENSAATVGLGAGEYVGLGEENSARVYT